MQVDDADVSKMSNVFAESANIGAVVRATSNHLSVLPSDVRTVHPSALKGAKLGVYQAMTEQGIKQAELARPLSWHMPLAERVFDLRHASRLDQIEAAARALGRRLELCVA